jgi:hypothetical protein
MIIPLFCIKMQDQDKPWSVKRGKILSAKANKGEDRASPPLRREVKVRLRLCGENSRGLVLLIILKGRYNFGGTGGAREKKILNREQGVIKTISVPPGGNGDLLNAGYGVRRRARWGSSAARYG